MGAFKERLRPSAERRVALGDMGQRRTRSMDQLSAKVAVSALADPEQLRFAAGGELARDDAEPGRKIARSVEGLRPPDRRDEGGRRGICQRIDRRRANALLSPDNRMARS